MVVYKVDEFESIIKIKMEPFLAVLVPIPARNLGIARERWVIRARGRFHRDSRRILNKDSELWRKFKKSEIAQNALRSKGIFLGKFSKFLRIEGNGSHESLQGRRIRIHLQN